MKSKKRIVLAYSGGLDTSIILKWLQENYNAEVICYTADIGQEINRKKILSNAKKFGVKKIIIKDLKNTFVKDYVFPMIRGHAVYEGVYLLGTSIARPLIAKDQIRIAKKYKAYAVSHGATGKGNDQVRFELGYHYFGPKIKVIAPWRIWKLKSRTDLINYAKKHKITIPKDKKGASPFSVDDNLFHTSTEGKVLENPKNSAPEFIFQRTVSPEKAPNKPSVISIKFKNGDPIGINGKKLSPAKLLEKVNLLAGKNGIGRVDLVENRFLGIKSRGVYETPGGTLLIQAHRAIESVTLDKETMHKKDNIMSRYAELIYNGYWYSKERFKLQKIIDLKKKKVNGVIKLKLYKGNITIESRITNSKAYSMKKVSFEENKSFNKTNVEKFISFHKKKKLNLIDMDGLKKWMQDSANILFDDSKNDLRSLPKAVRLQILLVLSFIWTTVFSLYVFSYTTFAFGWAGTYIAHIGLIFAVYMTFKQFHKAEEKSSSVFRTKNFDPFKIMVIVFVIVFIFVFSKGIEVLTNTNSYTIPYDGPSKSVFEKWLPFSKDK